MKTEVRTLSNSPPHGYNIWANIHRSESSRGGNGKTLQNHVDISFQLGACNSEPSPHPFAVRQQHGGKMEPHLPSTQAMQDHTSLLWNSQSHMLLGYLNCTNLVEPNLLLMTWEVFNYFGSAYAEVQLSTKEYFHCYPTFPLDLAFYPLIRVQFKSILSQKLG